MRSTWEVLYERFVRSTMTLRFQRNYQTIRQRRETLGPFADPAALLDFLGDRQASVDAKDLVYGDLVREVQTGGGQSSTAMTLLWIGLWPGLDTARQYLVRFFWRHLDEELICRITQVFQDQVYRANLNAIRKVAATLVMNTKRDVREARLREVFEQRRIAPLDDEVANELEAPEERPDQSSALEDELAPIAGQDWQLVVLVHCEGLTVKEAAAAVRLPEEVAKGRLRRAIARLRRALEKKLD